MFQVDSEKNGEQFTFFYCYFFFGNSAIQKPLGAKVKHIISDIMKLLAIAIFADAESCLLP